MRLHNFMLFFPEAQRPPKPIMATVDLDEVNACTSAATGPETTLVYLKSGDVLHITSDYWTFSKLWCDPTYDPDKEH